MNLSKTEQSEILKKLFRQEEDNYKPVFWKKKKKSEETEITSL